MKNIVILGAGTAGALVSNLLAQHLDLDDWQITLIDRAKQHVYQPGLLFIPFGLYGYDKDEDLTRDILDPLPKSARFVAGDVKLIDHAKKRVETDKGIFPYDYLVSSMGCHLDTEAVEGLADVMGTKGVHTFYTLDGAQKLKQALNQFKEGRLVIDICEMPIKCPVAPIEFAFLADFYLKQKGIRDRVEISLVTPYAGAFTKPNANRVLSTIAEEKGIKIVPNFSAASVDADKRKIASFDGRDVEYDLLVAIPANSGPAVLDDSGLGDGSGFALTDPRTLKSKKADFIYCMGDNTNVATSKAGSVAHFESDTVLENILHEINGKPADATFDGHANCFIESGHHKALLIDFNYDMEPLEGSFPMPVVGPFSLLKETYMNHMGKLAFKWVYWNLLLPGRLGSMPFVEAHMSFMGKQIDTAPQARHAGEMRVADVMTKDVITVRQGSSLAEAAKTLAEKKISGLPVMSNTNKLVGILTEADFISAMDIAPGQVGGFFEHVVRKGHAKKRMGTIVDDLMTRNPYTVRPEDSLSKAIQIMDKHHIKRLMVTDGHDGIAGVVSRRDMMKMFAMK
jgi:sulfide:quinone oxidoreductase